MTVPHIPRQVPVVKQDGTQTDQEAIYRRKLEAALKDALARIEALEAFHP